MPTLEKVTTQSQLTVRLCEEDMAKLTDIVRETNIPRAVLVRQAVRQWLKNSA